ncbi:MULTISPECIES: JmjC domain-containing protein [unclassified Streptomyces]|uniref:JmjC domain-containing protein n=1 Tax=unclassified Streptomyces TaxID=2593676 RepID=UPI0036C8EF28
MSEEPILAVEAEFSWSTLMERYWDRRPVLFRSVAPAPFTAPEVFRAAVRGCATGGAGTPMPPNVQFTVDTVQRDGADGALPAGGDGAFDAYDARLAARLDDRRYALVVNGFHAFDAALWSRERAFFAPLWQIVGLPLTGAITTLFHGTYEHSPVGVHKDRFATFLFGLRGRKRMRFWPRRPWDEPVSTKTDYAHHIAASVPAEVSPGELLYWPADYYHVGESATAAPATSVNVGIPRDEHHTGYELEDLLADLDPARLAGRGGLDTLLGTTDAPLTAPGPAPGGVLAPALPEALTTVARALYDFADPVALRGRVAVLSLRRWTAGGFEPVPPAAAPRPLRDADRLRGDPQAPVLWAPDPDTGTLCAANGHETRTPLAPDEVRRLTRAPSGPDPVAVGALLRAVTPGARRDEGRALLERLESFRAYHRAP